MTLAMTNSSSETSRDAGLFLTFIGCIFILSLPFSSVANIGVLGNFDSNLALYSFIPLVALLVFSGLFTKTLFYSGPEGGILRVMFLMFVIAAIFTVANGFRFKSLGYFAYNLDPLDKSLVTSVVPLLIAVLYISTACVGRYLKPQRLEASLMAGLWLAIGYAAVQFISYHFPNPFYSFIWPLVEGAKDRGGVPYYSIYQRLNGPASEPAEFVKLLLIFYLPWVLYSINDKIHWGRLFIICLLTAASKSITGYVLLAFVFAVLFFSNRVKFSFKGVMTYIVLSAVIVVVATGGEVLGDISNRLSELENDASTNVRATYNLTAMQVAFDYPILGIGWSNEIFLFPQRLADSAHLWEIRRNIEDGVALTAKSLLLRLLMYTGIPLFVIVLGVISMKLASRNLSGSRIDISRTRLAFMLLLIGGAIDGGIVTSFFMWAATALPLGYQMRRAFSGRPAQEGSGSPGMRAWGQPIRTVNDTY
jgi:hypothetical protein